MVIRKLATVTGNEKGSALILAISLVSLLAVLALGYGVFATTELQMGLNDHARWQASYLAEAGINRMIWELREKSLESLVIERILRPANDIPEHYFLDTAPGDSVDNLVVKDSTNKILGDVSVELFRNQLDLVVKARGTYSGTERVIEATIRNGEGDPAAPLRNYTITSWHEY